MKKGDIVQVKKFTKRPTSWNSMGEMDKYMGKLVTIYYVNSNTNIRIEEDECRWRWEETDFVDTNEINTFTDQDFEI